MRVETSAGVVEVIDERAYAFDSVDNARTYPYVRNLGATSRHATSVHGLLLNGAPLAVFGRGGGASGVHEHSLICAEDRLYLAAGDCVVSVTPRPLSFNWMLETDSATCFGVHFEPRRRALISHGELEISRFTAEGALLWQASGADIFSGPFSLRPECIEATDWNDRVYRFDYETGRLLA